MRGLRDTLGCVCNQDIPVMVIVNQNMIVVEDEKNGGKFIIMQFFIMEVRLCDLEFPSSKYTWCNE